MAAETVSELYFRLGLDYNDLKSGFVEAENTLTQNLRSLEQQKHLIQLRAQVEINGLDDAEKETESLRIEQESLNKILDLQRDKIELMSVAYQEMAQTQGENATITQNLAIQLEQERLAMANLQTQTNALAESSGVAFGVNWEVLGLIEPAMKLTDIAARGASTLSILGRAIPVPQVKMAAAALVGLSAVISGTAEATEELAENNSAQTFADNLQNASAGVGTSFASMQQNLSNMSAATDKSFQSVSEHTSKQIHQIQQESNTFVDWARDFFRVAFLLTEESDNFSDAISKVNSQSQFMRTELGEYAVVVAGIIHTLSALANSAFAFTEPAIKNFRDLNLRSNELNISLSKTSDLLSLIDLAGADYNDVRDYVRGVQDAVIKGDSEDPEVIALTKYGVAIQDTHGKLLSFDETLENLYQGYLKAKEAGEEEAYVIMTNGQAVQDVLPFFEKLAKAKENYAKIKWSTLDFDSLQKTSDSLKLLEIQTNEYKNSIQSLGLPITDYFAQRDFTFYKMLTEVIEENRESVLEWEFVFIEALKRVDGVVDSVLDSLTGKSEETESTLERVAKKLASLFTGNKLYSILDTGTKEKYNDAGLFYVDDSFFNLFPEQYQSQAKGVNLYEKYNLDKYNDAGMFYTDDSFFNIFPEQYRDKVKIADLSIKEKPSIFDDAKKDLEEYIAANEKAREETEKTSEEITAGLSYSYNRIAKYKEELANIEIDIKFGDDEYGKSLAKLDTWYDTAMKDAKYYAKEIEAIEELYAAKAEQIEKNRLAKIEEIRKQYSNSHQTELEKQLADIESQMQSWIKIGMDADEALVIAEKRKNQAIQQLEKDFLSSTNQLHKTELEQRLVQIETEKQAWIQKGIDEVRATEAAERQKAQVRKELEDSFLSAVNSINQTDIERQFSDIEREQKDWIQKGIDPTRAMRFAEAQEIEALKKLNDEWAEHVNSIYQTSLENRLAQIDKEKQAWIQKGIDEVKATQAAEEQKAQIQKDAALSVLKSQIKEYRAFQQGGYEGLKDYQLNQLYRSGIRPEDLQMTPQQLATFQKAQQVAQNSLLPNFMTNNDRANQQAFLNAQYDAEEKRYQDKLANFGQILTINGKVPDFLSEPMYRGMIDKYQVPGVPEDLDLSSAMNNLDTYVSDLTTNINTATESLSQIPDSLSELPESIAYVTESLEDFSTTLSEIELPSVTERQPTNVNVTVQIEEAHAWDTEHIQELADKVADQIEPAIVNAIGGDSNRY